MTGTYYFDAEWDEYADLYAGDQSESYGGWDGWYDPYGAFAHAGDESCCHGLHADAYDEPASRPEDAAELCYEYDESWFDTDEFE